MSNINDILTTLKDNTQKKNIDWVPTSSRNGFLTATSKGSIRIEKSDFSKVILLKILNLRGVEIETFEIKITDGIYGEFDQLFNNIKSEVYNVDAQIDSILSEIKDPKPKPIILSQLFPGTWKNNYKIGDHSGSEFPVEINDNKYYLQGKYWFDLTDISMNPERTILKFTKVGIGPDQRRLKNELRIINLGSEYEGTEIDENVSNGPIHTVKYTKL